MTVTQDDGERLVAAARSMVGCPFLLNGRNPATGVDCVGLISACLVAIGRDAFPPQGYGLRNRAIDRWLECAVRSGLEEVSGKFQAGDIVLVSLDGGQHHLLIIEQSRSVIHAHAGLRRVVREPLRSSLEPTIHWRLMPRKEG